MDWWLRVFGDIINAIFQVFPYNNKSRITYLSLLFFALIVLYLKEIDKNIKKSFKIWEIVFWPSQQIHIEI